jgi:hypothetical protein
MAINFPQVVPIPMITDLQTALAMDPTPASPQRTDVSLTETGKKTGTDSEIARETETGNGTVPILSETSETGTETEIPETPDAQTFSVVPMDEATLHDHPLSSVTTSRRMALIMSLLRAAMTWMTSVGSCVMGHSRIGLGHRRSTIVVHHHHHQVLTIIG